MSTLKGGAINSGLTGGGYSTAWRLTVESPTLEPQTYGELVQLYGDQLRLWDFMMWAKRTHDIKARTTTVLEEGAILDTLDVKTEVAAGAAGATVSVVSAKGVGRIGFTVHIPAKYTGTAIPVSYKITNKSGTADPFTYTLTPLVATSQITVAIPVGAKLAIGAPMYAPGEGQPAAMKRSWYSHTHKTRIVKETMDIEGGQAALQEWAELAQAKDGSTLLSRSLNETEFRLRVWMNDYLLMGQPNTVGLTGANAAAEANVIPSDYGLIPGMYQSAMKQYYTGSYTKDNFDIIKYLLASQGVGAGTVNFLYGQELGTGIENSGLEFIREFSGGTDLYKNMSEVGFIMKAFTKNGIRTVLTEIPEFSNPIAYGADGYNFETMGMIFPDAKVTASMNYTDGVGRAMSAAEKKPLNHVSVGYLNNNGENRKLIVGDAAGVNGLGYKFTNEYDSSKFFMLSELSIFLLALNQSILVLKSA